MRLSKKPATNADAVGMLEEIKAGRLAGIYCVNWKKAALRAQRLGKYWWTVIPPGEDAVLMLDPDNPTGGQPLIAFRRELDPRDKDGCGKLKTDKTLTPSPARLDAALLKAWARYRLWQTGQFSPCPLPLEFTDFSSTQESMVCSDLDRARRMLDVVLRRLRTVVALSTITQRSEEFYDTKLKTFSVFKVNTFTANDLPVPDNILARLRNLGFPGGFPGEQTEIPPASDSPSDAIHFAILLENFKLLRRGLDQFFPKVKHAPSTERRCRQFAAFVVHGPPWDPLMHFCKLYFDEGIVNADGRAVTIIHERDPHTLLQLAGHPVTGNNPYCIWPHLGDPRITTFDQARKNAYCYEWLTYAAQPDYNPDKHAGIKDCGDVLKRYPRHR